MRTAVWRLLPMLALSLASAGCATRTCGNPYVLDFVDAADRKADLSHLGLVRDAVRTDPSTAPDVERCAVWERVRNPAYGTTSNQPAELLRAQHFQITHIDVGWRVDGLPP
jgi:hypothetical protein